MLQSTRRQLRGYLIAIGSLASAASVWLCLTLLIGNRVSSSFILVAVAITARFTDAGPSWFALAVGAALVAWIQYLRLGMDLPAFATIIVVYFFLGAILVLATQSERAARQRAELHAEDLKAERNLLRHVIEEQEQDKKLICCEIHDGMVQDTAGALMLLEGFRQARPQSEPPHAEKLQAIDKAIDALRRAVDEGRRVIRGVRPIVLDDLGVVAAIKDLVHQSADFGVDVQFECDASITRLPKNLETALYRVTQEALTNAKKHSGSNSASIDLRRDQNGIVLRIRDSGRGFDVKAPRNGAFGLLGMTARVRLLGGTCFIDSRPGAGTQVVARFPLPQNSSEK